MTQTTWIIAEIFAGIALLTILTALMTRWFGQPGKRGPEEILKERYARGELSRSEYQRMAEDLGITSVFSDVRSSPVDEEIGAGSKSSHAH